MRTTAIFNLKGGVGKTTTVCNLAAELAARDKRVVVIDADPQCNATGFLTGYADMEFPHTTTALLRDSTPTHTGVVELAKTTIEGVKLVPADEELALSDLAALRNGTLHGAAIRDMCDVLAEEDITDYVLIDCSPSFSAATVAALAAADDVIIPLKVDAFSVRGMGVIMRQIGEMLSINPGLRVAGVLMTMVDLRTRVNREGRKLLEESAVPIFDTFIRRSTLVDISTFFAKPICMLSGKSGVSEDYGDFCEEYMRGGAGRG